MADFNHLCKKKLLNSLYVAISSEGQDDALDKYEQENKERRKGYLRGKWEGYHLLEYVNHIIDTNNGIDSNDVEEALRKPARISNIADFRNRPSTNGIPQKYGRKVFEALTRLQGFKFLLEGIVDFLDFCEQQPDWKFTVFKDHSELKAIITDIRKHLSHPQNGQQKEDYQPTSDKKLSRYELSTNHPRLAPNSGEFFGRKSEISEVEENIAKLITSEINCFHVCGGPGIGKTEVCKVALRNWLEHNNHPRAFWVPVSDNADARRLLTHLGEAVGIKFEELEKISEFSQLRDNLPNGLYYLDNIENVAESEGGRELLRTLSQTSGIRIMASSRPNLDGVLGIGLEIGKLDAYSSPKLFLKLWNGKVIPDQELIYEFTNITLEGHALSIVLLARLGKCHSSFGSLVSQWDKHGTLLTKGRKFSDRLLSLEISFSLTRSQLSSEPGALDLWQFCALFHDGFNEKTLNLWEKISGYPQARVILSEHYLITFNGSRITMSPPIARYARDYATINNTSDSGFNWKYARYYAFSYFIELLWEIDKTASTTIQLQFFKENGEKFSAIAQLFYLENYCGFPNLDLWMKLHKKLMSLYSFNYHASKLILQCIIHAFNDPIALTLLGELELNQGSLNLARQHFSQAIKQLTHEGNAIVLPRALSGLGDLEYRYGDNEKALELYTESSKLCEKNGDQSGLIITLTILGNYHANLSPKSSDEARNHFHRALKIGRDNNLDAQVASLLTYLGEMECNNSNFKEALHCAEEAVGICKKTKNFQTYANSLKVIGHVELNKENFDLASSHFQRALEIFETTNDLHGLAGTNRFQGETHLRKGDIEAALVYYSQAEHYYATTNDLLGHACTIADILYCKHKLGTLEQHELYSHAKLAMLEAIKVQKATAIPYVRKILFKICDCENKKLDELLAVVSNQLDEEDAEYFN